MKRILLITALLCLLPLLSYADTKYTPRRANLGATVYALTEAAGACALPVGVSNIYTLTPTDNTDTTITFSGAGTADEIITFHTTLVNSVGTLTLGTTAARYYTVTFVSNGTAWYEVARTAVQS